MTNISTTAVNLPTYYHQFQKIQGVLVKISLPYIFFIALIGFVTNTSTVLLLSKNSITKNLKNRWTLIALALSDLLFNIALLIRGIHDVIEGDSERLCLTISFLSHLAELLSACYTVSFTIQRFAAVHDPFQAARQRRSSPIISLLLIFIFSLIFCVFLSHTNTYVDCHEELKLSWFIADALASFVIPFSLILIFNILIVSYIRKHSCSPISVQSTLARRKNRSKNYLKPDQGDETCETDNNAATNGNGIITFVNCDENRNVEIKCKKKEDKTPSEIEQNINQPSVSSSLDRVNSETSSILRQSQSTYRQSKIIYKHLNESLALHSFATRSSDKSSNDIDLAISLSKRTSQSVRLTRMLVLVSTCFLILNAPAHSCIIALKIYTSIDTPILNEHHEFDHYHPTKMLINNSTTNFLFSDQINNRTNNETIPSTTQITGIIEDQLAIHLFYIAVLLTQSISYASHSVNFFLYSFSGITFRTSLRQLINKFRRH